LSSSVHTYNITSSDNHQFYCFTHFHQEADTNIKRGFYQKGLVLVSHLPLINLFEKIVRTCGPTFHQKRVPIGELIFRDISRWEKPFYSKTMDLLFFNTSIQYTFPPAIQFPCVLFNSPKQKPVTRLTPPKKSSVFNYFNKIKAKPQNKKQNRNEIVEMMVFKDSVLMDNSNNIKDEKDEMKEMKLEENFENRSEKIGNNENDKKQMNSDNNINDTSDKKEENNEIASETKITKKKGKFFGPLFNKFKVFTFSSKAPKEKTGKKTETDVINDIEIKIPTEVTSITERSDKNKSEMEFSGNGVNNNERSFSDDVENDFFKKTEEQKNDEKFFCKNNVLLNLVVEEIKVKKEEDKEKGKGEEKEEEEKKGKKEEFQSEEEKKILNGDVIVGRSDESISDHNNININMNHNDLEEVGSNTSGNVTGKKKKEKKDKNEEKKKKIPNNQKSIKENNKQISELNKNTSQNIFSSPKPFPYIPPLPKNISLPVSKLKFKPLPFQIRGNTPKEGLSPTSSSSSLVIPSPPSPFKNITPIPPAPRNNTCTDFITTVSSPSSSLSSSLSSPSLSSPS
jgi:hypothetical protein